MDCGLTDSPQSVAKTYSELFDEAFSHYLAIGMSAREYWHEDCTLVKAYRKADEMRQDRINFQSWLHGLYVYDALACISPILQANARPGTKAKPYPSQPYPLKEEKREVNDEKRIAPGREYMELFAERFNQQFAEKARKGSENNGGGKQSGTANQG